MRPPENEAQLWLLQRERQKSLGNHIRFVCTALLGGKQ